MSVTNIRKIALYQSHMISNIQRNEEIKIWREIKRARSPTSIQK